MKKQNIENNNNVKLNNTKVDQIFIVQMKVIK